ncbi:MAG: MFS transporter [Anaerolineaceae bacterium]|nr:MFS transporter [Anaerolineaceae bacterium]
MKNTNNKDILWNRNYISILIANCFVSISFFILNPTFPVYIKSLINDLSIVGLISSLFLISAMLIRPFSGYLTDIYNKRKIFIGGLFILCISIVGYIFLNTIPGIIFARLLHGIGMGLATTAFGALAAQNIPPARMGEGMGYYGLGMVFGMSIGPSIGIQLLNSYSAKVAFGVAGGFSILGVILIVSIYRKRNSSNLNIPKPSIPRNIGAFFNIEKSAMIPASLIFFIGIIVSAITTYLVLFSIDRGISNIGFFFTIQSAAVLLSRLVNGRIADKKGYRTVIVPSIMCLISAMVLLFFATTPIFFMITAFLYGLGYGTLTSACQALSVLKAKPEKRGLAISTYYLGMDAGNGFGTILCGIISKMFGYAEMYLLSVIPLLIGLMIYLFWSGDSRNHSGISKASLL